MATAEELKEFLSKRGYNADIVKAGAVYHIAVRSEKVSELAGLIASLEEPGKFIIQISIPDLMALIDQEFSIFQLKEFVARILKEQESMGGSIDNLNKTDDVLKQQSENSLSGLRKLIEEQHNMIKQLDNKLAKLQSQPWWKFHWKKQE